MMDFQTPLSTLSGLVKPPSPCTSAMSRKNSCNLVYVKVFSFSTFFITINVNSKRVINAESYHFTTWLNSSNFTMGSTLVPEVYFSSPLRNEINKNKPLEPG
jgi:hypothetical protein